MLKDCTFHHIGYAVKSIAKTAARYVDAGYTQSEVIYDPIQQTNIAFLTKNGCPRIELVEGVYYAENKDVANTPPRVANGDKTVGVVQNILQKVGVSPYHVCYEVKNIEEAIMELRKQRDLQLCKPVEAVAIDNKKICYLMHPEVGLIEIVEQ